MPRSAPARCESGSCVGVLKLCGELGRRQIAEARMRAHLVEVLAPGFDEDLGLAARPELLHAQAFVAELAVEALRCVVLPGLAGVGSHRSARVGGVGRPQSVCTRADAAPAAPRAATNDEPGRDSSDGHHGRGRSGCGGSSSADTAPIAWPCASGPACPRSPWSSGSPAPSGQPSAACRIVVATGRGDLHTQPARDGPARLLFFAAISFITSISRSRSVTSFFSRTFSCSSCFRRRTSSGWNDPNRFFHL